VVLLRMATIKSFEELEIWKDARELNRILYFYINRDNFSKDYKLVHQINGSCGSIMDNIAEGFGRASKREFIQFLSYANGSANEFLSQLHRVFDRNYITQSEFETCYEKADYICRRINKFISYLNKSVYKGEKFKNRH
jgi:four helix bundle protein